MAAIAGLGLTEVGKVYGRTSFELAAEAVALAAGDAGLTLADVDGLLINPAFSQPALDLTLARRLGLRDLRVLSSLTAYGASAGVMVAQAAQAVDAGAADVVACVFADTPRSGTSSGAEAYQAFSLQARGVRSAETAAGLTSTTHRYALAADRYMSTYGVTHDELGAVAVSQRRWAEMNPVAAMRTPLSLEEYHASRWVVEPLHLLDCCLVSNGGAAVIVTSAERARDLRQPPVHVRGWGQAHPAPPLRAGGSFGLTTGAKASGRAALAMAGLGLDDVQLREIYDCYTYTVLVTLEDYGFCGPGEAGALAASGALGPGGALPTNTGGGQLSSFYLWGMTPLHEAVVQVRGQAGERQVGAHDTAMVSGNGGILEHHSTLVLTSETAA
ncbi:MULTISPECIES: thiolase family protein [Nocardioides]|uniref:Thiolase family protein n=1 Tax=Nocardioides vastitatis TaxID=2568655 RepID=A0ABW0ZG91_9ACTN|nr:thiolase family protein [Nocardioides sp.]THJ04291.1 thiolase family protein [Nocardioides sp.]